MESPSETPQAEASARTFSQVVFTNIPHSYSPSVAATCHYTLTAGYQPHPRDWVGIFKVGWSTTKEYHTFVWAEHSQDGQEPMTNIAVFKDYYLPKDETEFYQFCYIDNSGQVRGASTPFSFKGAAETNMESIPDDDILFITTQEQVEQSLHEKTELQKELDRIKEEFKTLKLALQKEQRDLACLKGQNEQKEKDNVLLVRELDQIKEQNGILVSTLQLKQQEVENLKVELSVQKIAQMDAQQQSKAELNKPNRSSSFDEPTSPNETHTQEKYDRAVLKIKQLKQEREELKRKLDAQTDEILSLGSKLREGERDLLKARDSVHLIQVDLQSSEKEKERLSAELQRLQELLQNVNEVKRENQELHQRLSQQEVVQNSPDGELKDLYETVARQLQDTQGKLAHEKEESVNYKTRAALLDKELQGVKKQLDRVAASLDQEKQKSSKVELQFTEAREALDEQDNKIHEKEHMIRLVCREKEDLTRENENLKNDIEGLRKVYADLQEASQYMQPDTTSADRNSSTSQQDTPEQVQHVYETIDDNPVTEEEPILVCRHCQESFPGITHIELEQHEGSHRVCPFCTLMCDSMEQSVFEDHVYSHEL
ncbi:calcium-binding and coiled-coil domain-containing protein 2 [Betta splendens]|uniref:Calcium-binding and coiled-coil domain-containing protein 2 n=1 Tax=Betta splendens TaxID=158456 RepID=A0A6P7L4T9_BETSP|nr:calcium-binding and coiled-coil domain-containing protein 2 [Betta splendens]